MAFLVIETLIKYVSRIITRTVLCTIRSLFYVSQEATEKKSVQRKDSLKSTL